MPPTPPLVLRVIVLGNDAVLAARPATPTQVARACLQLGFGLVAPVSWGEELLAMRVVDDTRRTGPASVVVAHCPFVAEALRADASRRAPCWTGVAPPVATARYLRAAFADRDLHVTFAGRCPGATVPDVDERVLPEVLLGRLVDAGVVPDEQPDWFDAAIPPDRARYASLPGGVPVASLLAAETGAALHEAAPATLEALTRPGPNVERRVIDLEVATGCVCARERRLAGLSEPPRSPRPVVRTDLPVDLSLQPGPGLLADGPLPAGEPARPGGWAAREEPSLWFDAPAVPSPGAEPPLAPATPADGAGQPASPGGLARFVDTLEPWNASAVADGPRRARATTPATSAAPAPRTPETPSGQFAFSLGAHDLIDAPHGAAYAWHRATGATSFGDTYAILERERRRERRVQVAKRTGILLAVIAMTAGGAFGAQWLVANGFSRRSAAGGARVPVAPAEARGGADAPARDSLQPPAAPRPDAAPSATSLPALPDAIDPR